MPRHRPCLTVLALASLAALTVPARADTSPIIVGASLPLSGANAATGQETLSVLKAYFDSINLSGGIDGRPLQLNALDDAYEPEKALENTRTLAASRAVALLNCWGTANCSAMAPVATQAGMPLVGGIGAPPGRYVFNVRASTESELAAVVRHMANIGQTQIALVYEDAAFGKEAHGLARKALQQHSLQPLLELALAPDGSNAGAVAAELSKADALNGVILLASPSLTMGFINQVRNAGVGVQFYNLAAQANAAVVRGLGRHTSGVVFTTLVPSPWRSAIPAVREYQQLVGKDGAQAQYSFLGMEVYLNARTLVEGLRKAGRGVTRDSLVAALENQEPRHYGPMTVRFGPQRREGSNYVGLTMIDRRGQFIE